MHSASGCRAIITSGTARRGTTSGSPKSSGSSRCCTPGQNPERILEREPSREAYDVACREYFEEGAHDVLVRVYDAAVEYITPLGEYWGNVSFLSQFGLATRRSR